MNKTTDIRTLENNMSKSDESLVVKLNSFLFALVLMIPYLNLVTANMFPVSSPGVIFGALVVMLYMATLLLYGKIQILQEVFALVVFILAAYMISYWGLDKNEIVTKTLKQYLYYGVVSIFVASKPISVRLILRYMLILSMVGMLNVRALLDSGTTQSGAIVMGHSYALLPSICAAVIHIIYYRKEKSIFIGAGYMFNIYLFLIVFTRGTRGAALAIMFLFFILLVNQYKRGEHKAYMWLAWVSMICIIYVITDFDNIVKFLYHFTNDNGISINLINKTYAKAMQESALNGRELLYPYAIEGIKQSFLFGNGIGSFEIAYGTYPHNIVLQLMYEGGIILTLPIVGTIIYGFVWLFDKKTNNLDLSMMFTLLSSVAIPRLTFSANLWYREAFWLLMGFILTHIAHDHHKLTCKGNYI